MYSDKVLTFHKIVGLQPSVKTFLEKRIFKARNKT